MEVFPDAFIYFAVLEGLEMIVGHIVEALSDAVSIVRVVDILEVGRCK